MHRVTLPSGATADLRHAQDVTERNRRPIRRLQTQLAQHVEFLESIEKASAKLDANKRLSKAEQDSIAEGMGPALDLLDELNDRIVVALVAGWSYELPVSLDSILDIPGSDLDALRNEVSTRAAGLLPDFSPSKDKDSPTGV